MWNGFECSGISSVIMNWEETSAGAACRDFHFVSPCQSRPQIFFCVWIFLKTVIVFMAPIVIMDGVLDRSLSLVCTVAYFQQAVYCLFSYWWPSKKHLREPALAALWKGVASLQTVWVVGRNRDSRFCPTLWLIFPWDHGITTLWKGQW